MAEHNFSVENTLTLLLDDKKYHSLRDILSTMNPADIAAVFDELPESKLPLLFRLLPKELAAETFVEMGTDAQALLIRGFSDSELKEVIDELYVDDAVDIVEEMPANVGHHNGLHLLFLQKMNDLAGITDHRFSGFASIRNSGCVSEIYDFFRWEIAHDLPGYC